MEVYTQTGFIKTATKGNIKKAKKINQKEIKNYAFDNKEIVNKIIEEGKVIVRKHHARKVAFKILTLTVDCKLERELYIAVSEEMRKRYQANYLPHYGGWIIEEIPYVEDTKKSIKEMQEEFLSKNKIERTESEINYNSKDLLIYKSKSYINKNHDYKKAIANMTHVYDNLRFMTPDGSIDVLFRFKKLVAESNKRGSHQTIYFLQQTNNKNEKTRTSSINEINIPKFLEDFKMIAYDYDVCADYYKNYSRIKYGSKSGKTINVNGNKYTVDDRWDYEDD